MSKLIEEGIKKGKMKMEEYRLKGNESRENKTKGRKKCRVGSKEGRKEEHRDREIHEGRGRKEEQQRGKNRKNA